MHFFIVLLTRFRDKQTGAGLLKYPSFYLYNIKYLI